MKNSLFKRAIAAVATVPLALTQCLGVANAIANVGTFTNNGNHFFEVPQRVAKAIAYLCKLN